MNMVLVKITYQHPEDKRAYNRRVGLNPRYVQSIEPTEARGVMPPGTLISMRAPAGTVYQVSYLTELSLDEVAALLNG